MCEHGWTSLILTTILQSGDHSYLHVTNEEGEAQMGQSYLVRSMLLIAKLNCPSQKEPTSQELTRGYWTFLAFLDGGEFLVYPYLNRHDGPN